MQPHRAEQAGLDSSALLTDSYQLAMMQGYLASGMLETAVFELFIRRLPKKRNFLVAAGLEQLLDYLESLRFTDEEIRWLEKSGRYHPSFLEHLRQFRFTGDIDAMEEGTLFFADEPIVRVAAPLPEAQLIESRLMNLVHFQTVIASKAARATLVAGDRQLVDFGFRRAHGGEAGLLAARASYLAGFSGTSTVKAGELFGVPVFGTMAHSFVQAHESELESFERFVAHHVGPITLLIDTYDTERGAAQVAELARKLQGSGGPRISAVRLDSGDLEAHARAVRGILDRAGFQEIGIFVSSSLDEEEIERLLLARAPIDGFGVGSRLTTSADAPFLDCAYKLEEYVGHPKRKRSEGKATWPGRKQVFRHRSEDGSFAFDTLALLHESVESGEPLLQPVMRDGKRVHPPASASKARDRFFEQLHSLPEPFRKLAPATRPYRVEVSSGLKRLAEKLDRETR